MCVDFTQFGRKLGLVYQNLMRNALEIGRVVAFFTGIKEKHGICDSLLRALNIVLVALRGAALLFTRSFVLRGGILLYARCFVQIAPWGGRRGMPGGRVQRIYGERVEIGIDEIQAGMPDASCALKCVVMALIVIVPAEPCWRICLFAAGNVIETEKFPRYVAL